MSGPTDLVPAPLAEALARAGQNHVLRFWPTLDAAGRARLLGQLAVIDWDEFATLQRLARSGPAAAGPAAIDLSGAVTPPCLRLRHAGNDPAPAAAVNAGERLLAEGRVGTILVAGGQGTRMGCTGPKGLVPVGPVSQATLFGILCGRLRAVHARCGRHVPLAIMTSSATDADTRAFLRDANHAGLDPDFVHVFRQHDLPAVDAAAALLLDAPDHLAMAPDGHGGMLTALVESGGLDWFGRHGVEHVASFQVDNPLAMPLDREFLGYHLLTQAEFSTQVVLKREPGERVGIVVEQGGRHAVVEYSDLSPALDAERRPDGRLRFHAGSIAVHCFSKAFLDRVRDRDDALPLHLARKAVPFLDASGTLVRPTSPNAIKFERFIFDLLPLADRVTVVEIEARDGFAPLKNPPGAAADSPEHVHAALVDHARRTLAEAGVTVAEGIDVELDAATILDAADIAAVLPPGTHITAPRVIQRPQGGASVPLAKS
jgi:UDP-N-acetylglucosamine/UDP-N-acetylgalactosamine diphosphorylase